MKKNSKSFIMVVVMLLTTLSFAQGVTTSSLGGQVTDNNDEPLPGATVIAVHIPTGSKYGAATDFDGYYRISNMKSGGPYTVTISYVGFQDFKKENVTLQLGQSKRISTKLSESAEALDEVLIVGSNNGIFDSNKTGAGTKITRKQVDALPNVSRGIADFARLTPQAQIRNDNEISIAGQNNRFNSFYIDGTINNDVFGLSGAGTNGGQTGVNPISIDAIESFQVSVAPYDVKIGGFSGGAINAVTKSGTNDWSGSAYYLFRNQDLAGKTPGVEDNREKLADFTANTYGVAIGGPLVKDKVFFFLNYEGQQDETPQPFDESTYVGTSGAADTVRNFLDNTYGYSAGITNSTNSLESDKVFLRLDWNLNQKNKLSLRNNYVNSLQTSTGRSSAGTLRFGNSGREFESIVNTTTFEWNYSGKKTANSLILGYTRVRDDRNILGDPFPTIEIRDGDGRIFAGSEPFSTANKLDTDTFTLTNNFEIYSGRHTVTFGTHNEYTDVANTFFGRNFGEYTYNSLADFLADDANEYRIGYSLLGGTGDNSQGIAEFDIFQMGLYVQDEVQFSDNLKITAGLRFDVPFWSDGRANDDFNTRTVGLLEAAGRDLQGARVGKGPNNTVHVSPRIGFNYDVNGNNKTQIRGGLGIFTSRAPLVWAGGAFNNTGTTVGAFRTFNDALIPDFNPDVTQQLRPDAPFQGNVDLLAEDLKLPQVFKYSIAVDQKVGWGITLSSEIILNENINAVNYQNLNLGNPVFSTTGTGPRPNYGFSNGNLIDDTYEGIFLISNTSAGSSWNANFTAAKSFNSSLIDGSIQATYSYGESDILFDTTSSQNISNWAFNESVNGSNRLDVSTSDFDQGHRIITNGVIDFKWSDFTKTRIGLFYEGAEGNPFSYVVGGRGSEDLIDDTGEGFSALPFVPATFAQANLVDSNSLTAEQQWALLDAFIAGDEHLSERRGQFAERNGARNDWSHIVDLKFEQEFSLNIDGKKHKLAVTADIFNFTNFLNKDWGKRFFAGGFDTATLVNFEGFAADGTTPQYTFNERVANTINQIDDAGLQSSRWQMQVGVRYSF